MATPDIDVKYVADLARLTLTDEETATFQRQISDILGYVDQLNELDLDGIEPSAHEPLENTRADEARPGLERQAFLDIAPDVHDQQLRVPKVISDL